MCNTEVSLHTIELPQPRIDTLHGVLRGQVITFGDAHARVASSGVTLASRRYSRRRSSTSAVFLSKTAGMTSRGTMKFHEHLAALVATALHDELAA